MAVIFNTSERDLKSFGQNGYGENVNTEEKIRDIHGGGWDGDGDGMGMGMDGDVDGDGMGMGMGRCHPGEIGRAHV